MAVAEAGTKIASCGGNDADTEPFTQPNAYFYAHTKPDAVTNADPADGGNATGGKSDSVPSSSSYSEGTERAMAS